MAGSRKGVRQRLQHAALELYGERGFDRTTAADIAALAGVTERTYFRHFPDKREVLFDGAAALAASLADAVLNAPAGLPRSRRCSRRSCPPRRYSSATGRSRSGATA